MSPRANIRIENIINFLTFEVFKYTCRGLYETHKFLFTLLLCIKIDLSKGNITHEEFGILIKGNLCLTCVFSTFYKCLELAFFLPFCYVD